MKEKELNTYDGKEYMLKTYFIINNRKLFSTDNFNFEDNLKNCFYIKKFGSNVHPTIYLDTKIDNKWVNENQVIENYNGDASQSELWSEIFRSILQNTNQEKVENSKLYEELEAYQNAIKELKNQGIDVPTINEMNKANNIKLNNLKRKRAIYR